MKKFLTSVFLSRNDSRIRAGWRLAFQTLFAAILWGPSNLAANRLLSPNPSFVEKMLVGTLAECFVITLSVWLARRFLDKRSFISLGLRIDSHILKDMLAGILITFLLMGGIFLTEWVAGWIRFEGFAWQRQPIREIPLPLLMETLALVLVAWNEELLSRGYHLQTLASGANLFWGVFLSSSIFALLHLGNPSATWVSTAGIFFAGIFLAYGYLRTGNLWLSMGLHLGWNFFEGVFFGFPVSGLNLYRLTRISVSGPKLWTGGSFGPEAGLVVLPALALGIWLIRLYTAKRETPSFQDF